MKIWREIVIPICMILLSISIIILSSKIRIQKQKINKTIEKTIKEMLTRFGKALVKARKDSLKQGVMREGIRYPF